MAITLEALEQLDQQLTLAINSWHSTFSDPIMWFFSDKKVWIPMYALIIALMFWKLGWKRTLVVLVGVSLTVLFCDQFANLIKHYFQRISPVNDPYMVENGLHILEHGGGFSFFSAHAANSFGVALCTLIPIMKFGASRHMIPDSGYSDVKPALWAKIYTAWMVIWAFMVSISRIFVGKHFLGDVIVGIAVGICFGLIMGWICTWCIRKLNRAAV